MALHPSRQLGQNFLADSRVARSIVELLEPAAGDALVEVGPGLGALTEHLVGRGRGLTLIEVDRRLAGRLAERAAESERIEVVEADAATLDVRRFFAGRPVKVVGNLPYSAGGAILRNYLTNPSPVERAVFMLQKEVADRICAVPGSKRYGILTLRLQVRWAVRVAKVVPPEVFWPRPTVESAVLVFEPRDRAELGAFDEKLFDRLVRQGFSQRRKQLRKLLPGAPVTWDEVAAALGVPETVRAEEIPLKGWVALTNLYDDHPLKSIAQSGDERFDVVDADDVVTGQMRRAEVHAGGRRHRAVHIFVFNRSGELFLQKRSHLKDVHPGRWDSSAAGHLDAGEDYADAAKREIREELGIDGGGHLEEIARVEANEATGWEFVRLYRAAGEAKKIRWPASEIETGAFFPVPLIKEWVERTPEDFATGFLECFKRMNLQT